MKEPAPRQLWAVVRAAQRERSGRGTPFQFASLRGVPNRFQQALDRADRFCPRRIVPIVARDHEAWWRTESRALRPTTIIQRRDRGDGTDLLVAALTIASIEPGAPILFLSATESVEKEAPLKRAIDAALAMVRETDRIVLLGMDPSTGGSRRGWMSVDDSARAEPSKITAIHQSDDRPSRSARAGDLLATSMLLATPAALLRIFREAHPRGTVSISRFGEPLRAALRTPPPEDLYAMISERIDLLPALARFPELLYAAAVEECGWQSLSPADAVWHRAPSVVV